MSVKIDELLKEALIPSEKPDAQLNQEILRKAVEVNNMKKPFFLRFCLRLAHIMKIYFLECLWVIQPYYKVANIE